MIAHLKELIVVMGLALAVFFAARPLCRAFMRDEDFVLRRNVWILLTVCAFLVPSFWIYAGVAFVVLAWAGRRDPHPVALFLVAYAIIPPLTMDIPIVGINQLFALSQPRIASLAILLPLAVRVFLADKAGSGRKWMSLDWLIVGYIVVQVGLLTPYESITNTMRRSFLFTIDTLLLYYVVSRTMVSRRAIVDAMASFTLVGAIYAAIAIFESFKGWLLYEQIGPGWGSLNAGAFLLRGENLRAQVSAGHSLTLGYMLTMVFGFWLYLRTKVESQTTRWLVTALLCVGLYATHARGPWLTALVVYFTYLFIAPIGRSAFVNGVAVFTVLAAIVAATPLGDRIIDTLPFIGTVEQENVQYRQRLAEESWRLVWQNPLFGDPFVALKMEDLRQGQGIIDLMNAYAAVALFCGLIGLTLFAAFFLVATFKTYAAQRRSKVDAPDLSAIGAAFVACMVGSLFFMATASIDWVEYVLAGFMAAYIGLALRGRAVAAKPATVLHAPRPAANRPSF